MLTVMSSSACKRFMRMRELSIAAIFVLAVMFAAAGCAGTPGVSKAGSESRTGGIALDLLVEYDDGRRSFYRVFPDGTLGFGGGPDAGARRVTWTGTMSDEQIAELTSLIDEHRWRTGEPADGDDPDAVTFRIDLRSHDGRRRYRVKGESQSVMPVYTHLREISLQRFEHIIETLPQPSVESGAR